MNGSADMLGFIELHGQDSTMYYSYILLFIVQIEVYYGIPNLHNKYPFSNIRSVSSCTVLLGLRYSVLLSRVHCNNTTTKSGDDYNLLQIRFYLPSVSSPHANFIMFLFMFTLILYTRR